MSLFSNSLSALVRCCAKIESREFAFGVSVLILGFAKSRRSSLLGCPSLSWGLPRVAGVRWGSICVLVANKLGVSKTNVRVVLTMIQTFFQWGHQYISFFNFLLLYYACASSSLLCHYQKECNALVQML